MKKVVLVFLIIFLFSIISAQSINVNYPNEVSPGEEFEFNLELVDFDEGVYDVKIDIVLSSGQRVTRIFNDGVWKSTMYYINNILSTGEEKSFSLKINEDAPYEIANIIIRIRVSPELPETFEGYNIEIIQGSGNDPNLEPINNTIPDVQEEEDNINNDNSPLIHSYVVTNMSDFSPIETMEPQLISLGLNDSKDIKTENYMQEQEGSNYAIYGLVGFCIFLAFLYLIQKNRNNKNEFR